MTPDLRLATLVAAAIVLAAVPTAEGQLPVTPVSTSVSVIIVDTGRPAAPGALTSAPIQIAYQWQSGGASNNPTQIELSVVEKPDWALEADVDPPVALAYVPGSANPGFASLSNRIELNATLNFTLPEDAPAFRIGNFTVLARARPNGNLAESSGEGVLTARPDFVGSLNVTGHPTVARGGGWTPVTVTVRNDGNGETRVRLAVVSKLEPSEVRLPALATIAPRTSADFVLDVKLPWTTGVDGDIQVAAEGTSAVNPRATPVNVTATVAIDGQSPIPLPALLPVAALAASALGFLWNRGFSRGRRGFGR